MARLRGTNGAAGFSLVELLVVVVLLGIIGGATTSVVIATSRSNQYQDELQDVIDDGRISLQRIRKELRAARRLLADTCDGRETECTDGDLTTGTDRLRFWVDQDQNSLIADEELICYFVEELTPGSGQFQIIRYTNATDDEGGCDATPPSSVSASVIAQTLVDNFPFKEVQPLPDNVPSTPESRRVEIILDLEVLTGRGPDSITVEATVRLRNVA